jgi:spermidine/putrescine-binding protein
MMFINPKTDYAFKKIFGSEESKDILISFLNALIYDGNSTIDETISQTTGLSLEDVRKLRS